MLKKVEPAVFALKAYTVKLNGGHYYIAETARFDGKHQWSKSYKTLRHAITAIARKLEREWSERHKRLTR